MKQLKALFVLTLAVLVSAPAFAETQNVKVSGSIDAYAFYRNNYDLAKDNDSGVLPVGATNPTNVHSGGYLASQQSEADQYFRTNTQVEVSADLTDNVSTVINLVNQRDWNSDVLATSGTATSGAANEFDVELDLAYVQMKEIFYSPLTLTIGRQDIWFGRGFVIGNNNTAWDQQGLTQADEYSVTTAFDAVRATLDFNPWTLDFVWAKIAEGSLNPEDDRDLWISNINYKFAEYNAVAEGYYIGDINRNAVSGAAGSRDNQTHTIGGRLQFDPISQITIGGEMAYQLGDYFSGPTVSSRDRDAWALDVFGTYRWDNAWKPELTLEYEFFSGEEAGNTGDYSGWNPLFRGKFWTAYADFREFVYSTVDSADQAAFQNQQFIQVKGALKPMDDLLLEAAFTYIWMDEQVSGRDENLGYEIDLQATYDYTEDVSFGFLAGWFVPGDFYSSPNDSTATDLVGSMKVTF
jgi:hypothetical protein